MPSVACVLLTTHPKRERFLPDAVCSYREQTYPNKRLIVVNDGSPLTTVAPDILVVNLPDIGRRWSIGEKRNVGVQLAVEDYVATWDDDDVSLPSRLEEQVAFALAHGADYVLADKMHVADEDLNVMGDCNRGMTHAVMGSALIRRHTVIAAGGYSASNYQEDAELLERVRYLVRGKVICMKGCNWYVMRRHGNNVTLGHGETNDQWIQCGLRGPLEREAAAAVTALRASSGRMDVVSSSP